ncbi:MAG: hypothetical protein RJA63_1323 [Pseudomonadota bacterium]|jgi:hypothetical protein
MSPFKAKPRWTRRRVLAVMMAIATVAVLGGVHSVSATPTNTEDALIETLIQRVAAMTSLTFIRNGATATSTEAANHMRDKYAYFRREIVTAEDFIRLCGTRSEVTLQPYRVRRQDGSEQLTAEVLGAELRELRLKT